MKTLYLSYNSNINVSVPNRARVKLREHTERHIRHTCHQTIKTRPAHCRQFCRNGQFCRKCEGVPHPLAGPCLPVVPVCLPIAPTKAIEYMLGSLCTCTMPMNSSTHTHWLWVTPPSPRKQIHGLNIRFSNADLDHFVWSFRILAHPVMEKQDKHEVFVSSEPISPTLFLS